MSGNELWMDDSRASLDNSFFRFDIFTKMNEIILMCSDKSIERTSLRGNDEQRHSLDAQAHIVMVSIQPTLSHPRPPNPNQLFIFNAIFTYFISSCATISLVTDTCWQPTTP